MENRFLTKLLSVLCLAVCMWSAQLNAQTCEFLGLPGNITANNDAGACEACLIIPIPTLSGAGCAGIPDPNSAVTLGPQTDNLNIAPFNPAQATLGVTNYTIPGAVANAPAGTMVTISGDWNSDNSFFTENPTFTLEGTLLGNLPFGGPDCQANVYSFTVSDVVYNAAAADGQLDFVVGANTAVNSFCAVDNITTQIDYFTGTVPFANDYNGTTDASDCYPVGTTTVCYTVNQSGPGLPPIVDCFDVTVVDAEAPTFTNCPGNFIINLDPGDCEYIFDFAPEAVDNCPPDPINITLGGQTAIQAINCNIGGISTDNQHFRSFIATQELQYTAVNMAVSVDAAAGAMFTANVYDNGAGTFPAAGPGTLVATGVGVATGAATPYFLNFPLTPTAVVPAGNEVVIEIVIGAGFNFFPGYGAGQNGPTWIQAAACGAPIPTDVTTLGVTNGLVLNVDGIPASGVDVVQTVGLPSGSSLPHGSTYDFRYEATDAAGNVGVCEFSIEVKEFRNAITALGCNDNVQISLDENCSAVVGADLILEGGPYGCYDTRYTVSVDMNRDGVFAEGNVLNATHIGNSYNVQVTDNESGNSCWGSISVEDKLVPALTCEEVSILCSEDLTPGAPINSTASGSLASGFTWPSVGGSDEVVPLGGTPSNAVVTDVNVSVDLSHTWVGDLQVEIESPSGTIVQLFNNQCVAGDDVNATFDDQAAGPFVCGGIPVISGTVQPEGSLAAFNGEPVNGDWIVRIGDGVAGDGGTINSVSVEVGFSGTNAFPVGGATVTGPNPDGSYTVQGFDACGPATLTFEDDSDPRQCQNVNNVITRSWKLTDASGNMSTCDQTINLIRATLTDIVTPPNFDGVDQPALNCEDRCDDTDTRFCGPVNLYWNVLPAGHPYAGHPNPESELWGCGTVKCFGTGIPGGAGCGDIQSTFEDTRINICTAGPSEGCYKILRKWTILDWCTGEVLIHNQVIKVEDTEGPQINDIDDITISTDVWRCEADWYATTAWLEDNCSSAPLAYTVESTGGTVEFINGRWKISGLLPGVYTVTYIATDCCGNEAREDIILTVIDDVPPVVICDAHTVVSITTTSNINNDNLGLTKVFAHTFDDGSFDNCSSEIYFKAIRMNEFNSNGNTKNGEDVRLGDWASIDCDGANGDDDLRVFPPWYQGNQSYFDDEVKFCCADITDGPIMVVFRVYDIDPQPYTFGYDVSTRNLVPTGESPDDYAGVLPERQAVGGPLYGHYSDCMVEVEVQDKLPPFVVAPPDVTVTCDYWFPFDADNPNDYTDELDGIFGKVVTGPGAADPLNRDSINITDRVCPAHPNFAQFAPVSIFDDPCYDDTYDQFWGYDGYALDNCNLELEQTIIPNLHCARGSILRRWRASDDAGNWSNTATQRITIIDCKEWYVPKSCWRFTPKDVSECDLINVTPAGLGVCNNIFDPNRVGLNNLIKLIEWPCDVDITTCQGQGNGLDAFAPENLAVTFEQDRRPRLDDDNCNLLAATYTDEVFTFVDGACIKFFRNWVVIDWCLYEDFQNGVYQGEWRWEWTQVIKLLNQTGPVFADCTDKTFCGYGNPNNPNADQCVGIIELRPEVSDDCTPLEDLRIDFKLDLDNDGAYDQLGYSDNYGNIYPFPNPNFLPVRRFAAEEANADGTYPVGTHRILWGAEDGCGNATVCEYLFTIEDCKPPTAYCEIGISTIPMPDVAGGYVDLWASDFDLGSFDNCTAQADLIFSFSDDINDRSRRLTCADAGSQLNYEVYVWDEAGNYAICLVGVVLNGCDGNSTYNISGTISDEEGRMVEEVMMDLDGSMNSTEIMTDVTGIFDFLNLDANQNITLTPEKDINPRNGVTTFDIVLISKHILGIDALNSPYKMIAADVNNSGTITTFDMVELRKLILFIDSDFRSNTSWRFVDKNFVFPNAGNPFASSFPEVYSVNGLSQDEQADFVGVKIGDVNGSASPNSLISSNDRSNGEDLIFNIDDQTLTAGNEYTVDFLAKDFAAISGYQFSLNFNTSAVEFAGVETGALSNLTAGNFGTSLLDRGVLTTSWNSSEAVSLDNEAVAFSVTFRAKKDVLLSNILSLSSDYTVAQAYNEDLEVMNVEIAFNSGASVSAPFELMQNQPNPFRNETVIGFNLPQASAATLTIYDVSGKVLRLIDGDYAKGYNEVSLNRSELAGSGVLYYTLATDSDSATKKMIVVE